MKPRIINERPDWEFILPDSIADWDAPSHWERARCASMEKELSPGMVLYDVGSEHGWLSALYATFVGPENMVLIEPSPEFWVNIRKTWDANGFADPLFCFDGFVSDESDAVSLLGPREWPESARLDGPEEPAMAYRYLFGGHPIPKLTIDDLAIAARRPPDAITVDIEGAELLAMRGAADTLAIYRPLVWISVHPDLMRRDFGVGPVELFDFMDRAGYHREHLETDHEEHHFFRPVKR